MIFRRKVPKVPRFPQSSTKVAKSQSCGKLQKFRKVQQSCTESCKSSRKFKSSTCYVLRQKWRVSSFTFSKFLRFAAAQFRESSISGRELRTCHSSSGPAAGTGGMPLLEGKFPLRLCPGVSCSGLYRAAAADCCFAPAVSFPIRAGIRFGLRRQQPRLKVAFLPEIRPNCLK
jgi:hypothetical protein